MQIDLTSYIKQSLPKQKEINRKISPLLAKIRQDNINCIHQLDDDTLFQTKSQTLTFDNRKSKRKLIFQNKVPKLHAKSIDEDSKTLKFNKKTINTTIGSKRKRQSRTVGTSRNNPEQKLIMVNPPSKIRRHLIDHIDFQELQRAMFHKSDKINRFQHFCNYLKDKGPSRSTARSFSKTSRVIRIKDVKQEREEEVEEVFTTKYEPQENNFRITQKKRFWRSRMESRKRSEDEPRRLEVLGMGSTIG